MNRDDIIRMAEMAFDESSFTNAEVLRFADLIAAAERERVMQIVQSMKANLEAKFENVYMEGAMAGAAAEREACAAICDTTPPHPFRPSIEAAHAIRARKAALAEPVQQGCDHCNHPLYAAIKCRVCGRVNPQQ